MSDEQEQHARLAKAPQPSRASMEIDALVRDLGGDPRLFPCLKRAVHGSPEHAALIRELQSLRRRLVAREGDARDEARRRVFSGRFP